jgi:uncharacterized Fe-S cluster protein YjdI
LFATGSISLDLHEKSYFRDKNTMPLSTVKYTNGEVTVVWKPDTCIHSKICWTELREVFDPFKRPWVNMDGGTTERIIEQVKKCPSGALSYYLNDERES